jgi:hypothetical protein
MAEEDRDDPAAVADELYAVDPNDFVAGRTELVRRLRAEKRRDVAAAVAKLRRPTPAAWAVNQLARTRRADLEALLTLGNDLRAAQARALGGADAAKLREAAKARRDAIGALTGTAAGLLAARGAGVDAHLPGVTATLEAASLDADYGATVVHGRLSVEADPPSGFGGLDVDIPERPDRPARESEPEPEPAVEPDDVPDDAAVRAAAGRALAKAVERAEELAAAARSAAARVERRAQALTGVRAEVARLRKRLEDAERDLATAEEQVDEARRMAAEADAAAAEAADAVKEAGAGA